MSLVLPDITIRHSHDEDVPVNRPSPVIPYRHGVKQLGN